MDRMRSSPADTSKSMLTFEYPSTVTFLGVM